MKRSRFSFNSTHLILLSFLAAVLVGSGLLSLPLAAADGRPTPYIDALFTATTATCVTGLVVVPTVSHWSLFGQVVILLLIQIGGLGIITVMAGLTVFLHRRMGLADRLLLQDAFNLNTLSGLGEFVRKMILGTFLVEGAGALLYLPVFLPRFGARGIWIAVFTAVSAFCNAGIDIIAENSLIGYALNPLVNLVTALLIILGGIGYIVWWDVLRILRAKKRRRFRSLTLHSKIALSSTAVLLLGGAALILLFEYHNPRTIGALSFAEKAEVALFQSVTTRTAGFASVPQEDLTNPSAILCLLLMFIGGSPVGTAGGVKTVTFTVLIASALAAIRNRGDTELFDRAVPRQSISKAVAVVSTSFFILFLSTVLLSAVTDADALDILYETVSATATVGLTRNLTPHLNTWGKGILIVTMYLGRVGPISLATAFNLKREEPDLIKNPTEEISVG